VEPGQVLAAAQGWSPRAMKVCAHEGREPPQLPPSHHDFYLPHDF
jgi:hypothetical protein